MNTLRKYNKTHTDQTFGKELHGIHENELFYNCNIGSLSNVCLINCVLKNSKVNVQSISDVLNFAVTLDCHSFKDVELSPLLFDLLLFLLLMTKGNSVKRRKLIRIIGKERCQELLNDMKSYEGNAWL